MNSEQVFILQCKQKILSNQKINADDAASLINVSEDSLQFLSDAANEITRKFNGNVIDVETLINAKKGTCPEDCSFCSQSGFYKTGIDTYKLLPAETIMENAKIAKDNGVKSFCLVCAWRGPSEKDFEQICDIIKKVNSEVGIEVNCSLGFINEEMATRLKELYGRLFPGHSVEVPDEDMRRMTERRNQERDKRIRALGDSATAPSTEPAKEDLISTHPAPAPK